MPKKCFFITPIGNPESEEYRKLEALVNNVLNKILQKYEYQLIVAHEIHNLGSIGDQIFSSIIDADLVISNLTGLNANVMYETAVAHSFDLPTIMICETDSPRPPFDLIGDRIIFFDDSIEGAGKLCDDLENKIDVLQENPDVDNPVKRVLKKVSLARELETRTDDNSTILSLLLELTEDVKGDKKMDSSHDIAQVVIYLPEEFSDVISIKEILEKELNDVIKKISINYSEEETPNQIIVTFKDFMNKSYKNQIKELLIKNKIDHKRVTSHRYFY